MSATNILNDNKVLIQGATTQLFTVTFNKSITNNPTITLNSGTGVYSSGTGATRIYSLSNIKLMQEVITYGILIISVVFLVRKMFIKKTSSSCNKDCSC